MNIASPSDPYANSRSPRHADGVVGAIVIGGDYQGLGIVRSLGRKGIPVCVIDDEHSIAKYSKYTSYYIRTNGLRDERQAIETVISIGKQLGLAGWVLFPTREETVAAFSQHKVELSQYFRVPTAAWHSVYWAWDKRNTYQRGMKLGIPVPATWYVQSMEEALTLDLRYPVAIKPAIKEHFIYATKAKAWRVNNRSEFVDLYRKAASYLDAAEIMIQDIIPGSGEQQFAYCAFFKNGKSIGKLTVRRTRQHPAEFGRASTYVETVDIPELEMLSERFLRDIDYYGLVELEYKLDPRDGLFKLLDINARTWGYHTIGVAAGVDFPYMLYADQVGTDLAPASGEVGVNWVRLATDLPTAVLELLHRRLSVRSYVASLIRAHTEAVFCQDDLKPGFVELALLPYLYFKRGF